jgi:hypothetical protein
VLLQHRRDGHRLAAVAIRRLHDEDSGVDGAPEADEDLRARLSATVFAGFCRVHSSGGSPVEPTRARR